jgi:hypothetical protein
MAAHPPQQSPPSSTSSSLSSPLPPPQQQRQQQLESSGGEGEGCERGEERGARHVTRLLPHFSSGGGGREGAVPSAVAAGRVGLCQRLELRAGLELKLLLLAAAAHSGRRASLVEPFPTPPAWSDLPGGQQQMGGGSGDRDYDALKDMLAHLPSLEQLATGDGVCGRGLALVHWLSELSPRLEQVPLCTSHAAALHRDSRHAAAAAATAPTHQFALCVPVCASPERHCRASVVTGIHHPICYPDVTLLSICSCQEVEWSQRHAAGDARRRRSRRGNRFDEHLWLHIHTLLETLTLQWTRWRWRRLLL